MVKVTTTGGAVRRRGSRSPVLQLRATWSRSRLTYHPNWVPNGERVPIPTPPPPVIPYMGETTACPALLYTWLGRSCCCSRNLLGAEAARDAFLLVLVVLMAMAFSSWASPWSRDLVLAGGVGTTDSVSFATGSSGPLRPGLGMRGNPLTATDPILPPLRS